jgi:carbohydrate-binding DOMON domain-containing protein
MAMMFERQFSMNNGKDWQVTKVITDIENGKVKLCWTGADKKTMKKKAATKTTKKKAAMKSTKTAAKATTKKKSAMKKALK